MQMGVSATMEAIDDVFDKLLDFAGVIHNDITLSAIASVQAGTIAENIKVIDNQSDELLSAVGSTIANTLASAIAVALSDKEIKVLDIAKQSVDRKGLLMSIGLKNLRFNYESYVKPLEMNGWLTMTIPDKPTSPNQKYLTTLKGRLVLEILKKSGIE